MVKKPTYEELEQKVKDLEEEAFERKESEEDRLAHITFLENIDRLDRAIRNTTDLEQMMGDVLETALSIFRCDRAWLLFPCDPDAEFWSVPMERTVPEYPGAFALGKDIPTTPDMAGQFKAALESEEPLVFDPEKDRPMPDSAKQFSTLSSMVTAIYPKIGKPWVWGLSQCSYARVWSVEEVELFKEIGRRIADALSSLLFLRDLRESERKSRSIFDQTFQLTGLMTTDGTLIEANRTALSFAGIEAKDVLGKTFWETTWWTHSPELQERLRKATRKAADGHIVRFEAFHPGADGSIHILDFSLKPVKDEAGNVIFLIPEGHDITERKQTEESLRKSEDKYRRLVESLEKDYFLYSHNTDGIFTYLSPSISNVLGYTQNEFKKHYTRYLTDSPINKSVEEHTARSIKGEKQAPYEVEIRHKNGEIRLLEVSEVPVFDPQGNVISVEGIAHDITEHKRIVEELRISEEKFSKAFYSSPVPFAITSLEEGIFIDVNDSYLKFVGLQRNEVIGRTAEDLGFWTTPGERQKLIEAINKGMQLEFEIQLNTGGIRTIIAAGEQIRLAGQECLLVTTNDVTARKQLNEERLNRLLRMQKQQTALFELATHEAVVAGDFKQASKALTEIVAKTMGIERVSIWLRSDNRQELRCIDLFEEKSGRHSEGATLHEQDYPRYFKALASGRTIDIHDAGSDQRTSEFLKGYLRPNNITSMLDSTIWLHGEIFGVLCHEKVGKPRTWQDDEISFTAEVAGQVTQILLNNERRRTEEELQKLASVIRYSSELVNMSSLDGKMQFLNEAGCRMLGIEPEEVERTNIMDVIPDHLQKFVQEELLPALTEQRTWEGELQYINIKTNKLTDVHAMTFTIQDLTTGKPMYLANVSLDITERKRAQEMMIQSEKMLSVGGLAAGMAHEINNPLAGILQNVQVMKNRMSHDLEKNKKTAEECGTSIEAIEAYMEKRDMFRMIDSVVESGKRAAKIVNNMLSFSRKSESMLDRHDLGELFDKTLELAENDYDLKKKFDFRQIEIVREYDQTISQVTCEGSKIQQVFLNVLKNGAQAMVEGSGQMTADGMRKPEKRSIPRFIIRVMPDGEMARIEIEDNGPGMDKTTRKRVFEPFFTTKPVGTGTGLGLSVSYFIITENHGGTMTVESSPDKGAKFIIRLPIERKVLY